VRKFCYGIDGKLLRMKNYIKTEIYLFEIIFGKLKKKLIKLKKCQTDLKNGKKE